MTAAMSPAIETAMATMRIAGWELAETKHAHHCASQGHVPGVAMWAMLVDRCISASSRYTASTTASFHRTGRLAYQIDRLNRCTP